uniref:Transposase MuDR plant domain-containing protein n=1 Tax=Lactuca sativa TaxID=4236 RepID=A0A9R1VZD4_LACSA|nr:hypothetical protein LSAT_V11C300123450 [Lactuca sativa]
MFFYKITHTEVKVGMTELQRHNLFEFGELMIKYVRKNQMKGGRMMSTQNKKLLLIHGIVFLLFMIVHNLFLNLLGLNDKLIVNQTYNTKKELAFAVKLKAVREKFQIKVEKSSKSRYQVVCMQENCHWRLYAFLIKGI